jgi:hypothetical protein
MTASAAYERGFMEKMSLVVPPQAVAAAAERTPFQWVRTALGAGIAGGGGLAAGLINPGDPEHRAFSGQMQGLGSAVGGGAGILGGYRLADMLRGGRSGLGAGAANLALPFLMGVAGAGAGSMGGHALAKTRYEGNELWRWLAGRPRYEEQRRDAMKRRLMTLAAMAGVAGAGYAGYSMYKDKAGA